MWWFRGWQALVYSTACSVLYPSGTGVVKMNVFDVKFSQQRGVPWRTEGRECLYGVRHVSLCGEGVSLFWTSLLPSENRSRYWWCMLSSNTRYFCQSRVSDRLLTILMEDSDDFSRFLWTNTSIIFPTDHNLFLPVCFHFTIHSYRAVTRVGQMRALAAGAVYFGGAKWKRLRSKICELYRMAQSCFTRSV